MIEGWQKDERVGDPGAPPRGRHCDARVKVQMTDGRGVASLAIGQMASRWKVTS